MFDGLVSFLMSPIVWVGFALVSLLLSAKESEGQTGRLFTGVRKALVSLVAGLLGLWRQILLGNPVTGAPLKAFINAWTDERVKALLDRKFASHPDPMVRGRWADRLEMAKRNYRREDFPSLWIRDIPKDLRRSLVADGRLITGEPMSVAAESFVNDGHQGYAFREGLTTALLAFTLLFAAWHPAVYFAKPAVAAVEGKAAQMLADPARISMALGEDHWDREERDAAVEEMRSGLSGGFSASGLASGLLWSFADPLRLLFPLAFSLLLGVSAYRATVRGALAKVGVGIHDGTKEQIVRWKARAEQRRNEYNSYCEQIKRATGFDARWPLIKVGKATGSYRFRGRLDAPYAGQDMMMTLHDLHQSMLIIGGTGQGKTRSLITPMVKQILKIRASEKAKALRMLEKAPRAALPEALALASSPVAKEFPWPYGLRPNLARFEPVEYPLDISVYMTDGKATFYYDLKKIAKTSGQDKDLLIVGPHEGESSVDLLDDVEPQLVSDIIKSVAKQSGGGDRGGDSFWPDMAAEVVRNCAVVARAFDRLPEGASWREMHKERPYSLVFIYQLALDNGPLNKVCMDAVLRASENPDTYPLIEDIYTTELTEALTYLARNWLPMVSNTRDGIMANITQVMGTFASNPVLRGSFASGGGENLVSVNEFWGRIVTTNISTLDYGVAGRIINVFLKTLFMTEAIKRQQRQAAALSRLEMEFFDAYPEKSVLGLEFREIEEREPMMSAAEAALLREWREALRVAARMAEEKMASLGIHDPVEADGIMEELEKRAMALAAAKAEYKPEEAALLNAPADLEARFRERFPHLASRAALLDDLVGSPGRMAAFEGDARALEIAYRYLLVKEMLEREKMFFIADEYQTLITVDAKEGSQSDSSFWNISRSAGVGGIIATQSYSTLKQAVGDAAADNFSQQMRSKIFLPVEDPATFEFIKKLSGKALRSYTYDAESFESYDAMLMETNTPDPFMSDAGESGQVQIAGDALATGESLKISVASAFSPDEPVSANAAVKGSVAADTRFVPPLRRWGSWRTGVQTNVDQIIAARQAAEWRREDLRRREISEGNQEMEVFREDDFLSFGQNHAYAFIQRSGKARQDIISLYDVKVEA